MTYATLIISFNDMSCTGYEEEDELLSYGIAKGYEDPRRKRSSQSSLTAISQVCSVAKMCQKL